MNRTRNERGIALAIAIFALVVVGGLVSAAFFVGVQEQRVGRNTVKLQQAFSAAEGGAQQAVNEWSIGTYNKMAEGATVQLHARKSMPDGAGWFRDSLKRLNGELFLITSEGFSNDSSARQKLGLLVRLRPIDLNVNAALKSKGSLKLTGNAHVNGIDKAPTGWNCPPLLDTIPGVRLPPGDSANISGNCAGNFDCVTGVPKVRTDASITDSSLSHFGDLAFDDLRAMANIIINGGTLHVDPVVENGACKISEPLNWGDPIVVTSPCNSYFPIIWIDGDVTLNAQGVGQGVLLINGDLSVTGGFQFFGPVIVKGSLKTTGNGGHFNGGVVARNLDLDTETISGSATINFSSCALQKAMNGTAKGSAMRERGWINMY